MADTPAPRPTRQSKKRSAIVKVDPETGTRTLTRVGQGASDGKTVELAGNGRIQDTELPRQLPQWVRHALANKILFGLTYEQTAKRSGKSTSAVQKYGMSPAGQEWMRLIEEQADDPVAVAQSMMQASVIGVSQSYLKAVRAAEAAEDYNAVAAMSRDILDRFGVRKNSPLGGKGNTLTINLGSFTLEAPLVETSYREIMPAEIVDDE